MARSVFDTEHEQLRDTARAFIAREITPHADTWIADGIIDREVYKKAGEAGLIGFNMPEEYGGGGVGDDFRFNAVVTEEFARAGGAAPNFALQNDVVAPYFSSLCTEDQLRRWMPGIASGETILAIAMSEPGTGSDLAGIATSAVDRGDHYLVNGSKTFISSGINADLIVVVCRTNTDPSVGHKAFTLLVVERGMAGFERGRNLAKMGLKAHDTAELHFADVRVPKENVLGQHDRGFYHLMQNLPAERLSIGIGAIAGARRVFDDTLSYAKDRKAFGQSIGSFQANRFTIAEIATELDIAQLYVDQSLRAVVDGTFSAVDAAKNKWWCTELAKRVIDRCLQLHGGYGFMDEYAVSRAYTDSRIQTIFGGTTEIMKDLIGRDMGF